MPVDNIGLQKANSISFKQNISTDTIAKTEPYPNDSVEIQGKKNTTKKKNKLKKWASGFGITAATFIGAVLIMMSREKKQLTKLYKEKLVLSNLPEKINFKEAKTLEDAIKFTKETLGIKEIDQGFTLEALNTANKGIVDVSNAHKGKLFIPKRLGYEEMKNENAIAYVVRDINSKRFGDLVINKRYFDENFLNKEIENTLYYTNGNKVFEIKGRDILTSWKKCAVRPCPTDELADLMQKYYKDKSSLTLSDRQKLFYSIDNMHDVAQATHRNPIMALETILKTRSEFLKSNNININVSEVKNMSTEKQVEYLEKIIEKLESKGNYWIMRCGIAKPTSTIHHEMGHLQDYAKNLKELDLMRYGKSFSEYMREAEEDLKNSINSRRHGVYEVENRWGTIQNENHKKLFDENPEKFKKQYPEFYEFLTNQEIQQTAGKVSWYSQVGIGEFIAETYADMVAGKKIPEDVMALYRRYKGPEFV